MERHTLSAFTKHNTDWSDGLMEEKGRGERGGVKPKTSREHTTSIAQNTACSYKTPNQLKSTVTPRLGAPPRWIEPTPPYLDTCTPGVHGSLQAYASCC
ncbi:hypothetical protein RRG08_026685 [Elysia crispata]|uniref:Uncharacterized protein n=1 Tax=Elysia crispata TaxID=231223 RepID=A0AAE1AYI5_9GAST|nr:hypothetical protein RRG08_026685 [Elysia crispata]